jgi:hypothetical protein
VGIWQEVGVLNNPAGVIGCFVREYLFNKQKTSPAHWAPSPSGEGKEENRIVFSAAVDKKLKT